MISVSELAQDAIKRAKTLQKLIDRINQYKDLEKQKDKITNKLLAQQQKAVIVKEREQLQSTLKQEYQSWYEEILLFLSEHGKQEQFKESKNQLGYELRLDKGILALQHIVLGKEAKAPAQLDKWKQLISGGETDQLEFKSSLQWDYNKNEVNKHLSYAVIKSISAMLNSKGGFLLLGVGDDGAIIGIENEYKTCKRPDGDGYIQYLLQLTHAKLGKQVNEYLTFSILNLEDHDVCVAKIQSSKTPVFVKHENSEHFFIRASLTSQPLNVREATEYIKNHF